MEVTDLKLTMTQRQTLAWRGTGMGNVDTTGKAELGILSIFSAEGEKFERSALDVGAELLVISQFTLYASTRKGRRPDFTQAAPPEAAEALYRRAVELFAQSGLRVAEGRFREYMQVEIHNDGPVTILLDSAERNMPRNN